MEQNRSSELIISPRNHKWKWKELREIAWLFLKLGTISFGGPAAHIALMDQEVVRKRGWLDRDHFLSLLAATNLVPGPNATEMAIHIGYVHAGWPGLIAGGVSFILPAFLICLGIGWFYLEFGSIPEIASIFYGINPVVIAIILVATYRLGKSAIKSWWEILLGVSALMAALIGMDEALILLAAGVAGILVHFIPKWISHKQLPVELFLPFVSFARHFSELWSGLDDRLVQLGLFFLKVGSLLFGSGMVLFAFIQKDVVSGYGWLTQQQLIDAIAVGQMTPGPVSSSATFIGYLVSGWQGAIVATIAMFLPSFIIVAATGPLIPRLRRSPLAQAFLRGVNVAVVALILSVSLALFKSAFIDPWTVIIGVAGLFALLFLRIDTFWLIVVGAVLGLVHHYFLM